jgi:hypothetical protein
MKTLGKAAIPSLTFVCVLLITIFTVTACNNGSTDMPDGETIPPVFTSALLQATPHPASTTGTPIVRDSYNDSANNFYLIDVGYISDMYISTIVDADVDYTGAPIDFTITETTTEIYTTSLTETVSESIAVSHTDGTKAGISAELKAKFGVELTAKTNFEWSWSDTTSQTNSKSTSNTATTAKQYAKTKTIKFQFGINDRPHGRYRYAIYGTCDVYFILKTSLDNKTLLGWETFVCARPNDYFTYLF